MEQIKDINDTINEIIDSYKLGNNGMPPGAVQGADPRYLQQLASQYNMPQGAVPGAVQQPTYQNPYGPAVQQPTYQNPYGPAVQQPTYQSPYGPTYPPAPTREPTYDPASMFGGLSPDLQSALLSVLRANQQQ